MKTSLDEINNDIIFDLQWIFFNWRAFKNLFSNSLYTAYSIHFVYHFAMENSFSSGVSIKGIASTDTTASLTNQGPISASDGINKCKLQLALNDA